MAKKTIATGNEITISKYATNGLIEVTIKLTDYGEDDCEVIIEDGIMYAMKNLEIIACASLFSVRYYDKTK